MTFQAYALLSEYMGNLSDMESIKYILYDDNGDVHRQVPFQESYWKRMRSKT